MSSLEEHNAEQAAITAMCEAGTCHHPECHSDRAKVDYVCPECGEASIYATDVSVYWNPEYQQWALSDSGLPEDKDEVHCGQCGASFDLEDAETAY